MSGLTGLCGAFVVEPALMVLALLVFLRTDRSRAPCAWTELVGTLYAFGTPLYIVMCLFLNPPVL
jgi:hypothetical protein